MSDKTVGIIGQKYEDRKTGKCGVLESRDDKYKTLLFVADNGTTFSISNSSFRSNWRKVKDEEVVNEVEESTEEVVEPVEETKPEVEEKPKKKSKDKVEKKSSESKPSKSYDGISNEYAIATFIEAIMPTRTVEVINENDCISILVDNMTVIRIRFNNDDTFNLSMLPDVFTLPDWRRILNTSSLQFKPNADNYLGVIVDTKKSCIPEILDIIQEAVRDINLYGYEMEEDVNEEN